MRARSALWGRGWEGRGAGQRGGMGRRNGQLVMGGTGEPLLLLPRPFCAVSALLLALHYCCGWRRRPPLPLLQLPPPHRMLRSPVTLLRRTLPLPAPPLLHPPRQRRSSRVPATFATRDSTSNDPTQARSEGRKGHRRSGGLFCSLAPLRVCTFHCPRSAVPAPRLPHAGSTEPKTQFDLEQGYKRIKEEQVGLQPLSGAAFTVCVCVWCVRMPCVLLPVAQLVRSCPKWACMQLQPGRPPSPPAVYEQAEELWNFWFQHCEYHCAHGGWVGGWGARTHPGLCAYPGGCAGCCCSCTLWRVLPAGAWGDRTRCRRPLHAENRCPCAAACCLLPQATTAP